MKPRRNRFWRWTLYAFIGLVVLVTLFLVEEHVRGRIMLNRWMTQMKARGETFTLAEVLPATPMPEDNAAPYISPMLSGQVIPQSVPAAMRYVAPGRSVSVPQQRQWFAGAGSKIQFTTNAFRTTERRGGAGISATSAAPYIVVGHAELDADLRAVSNALALLKIGLRKSGLDYGINYNMGFNTPIMHLSSQRTAAQWLRAASLHALLETNLAESLDHLQDMAALVQLQSNGVFLIEQLVRLSVVSIAAGATWEALQVEGWNDEQLAALQATWAKMEFSPWLARCGVVERIIGADEIDRIAEFGPDRLMPMMGGGTPAPAPAPQSIDDFFNAFTELPKKAGPLLFRGVYFPLWRFAWKDQDKLNLYLSWEPVIEASRQQATNPNWNAHQGRIPKHEREGKMVEVSDARFLVSRMLSGANGRAARRAVEAETPRALVESAIALHRWKLKHGSFPPTLNDLVPTLLPRLPVDPFDGAPLRYRSSTNAFTLYSVGQNCRDDGGDPRPQTSSQPTFMGGRDIVWPAPATRDEIESYERK